MCLRFHISFLTLPAPLTAIPDFEGYASDAPFEHTSGLTVNGFVGKEHGMNGYAKKLLDGEGRSDRERDKRREKVKKSRLSARASYPSAPIRTHTTQFAIMSYTHGLHYVSHIHPHHRRHRLPFP